MALPYELQLARRDLGRHPWHSMAMVFGLALAVVVMVYIPSSMTSFYDDMIDRTIQQNAAHVTLWPRERQLGQMERALRIDQGDRAIVSLADHTAPRHRDLNGFRELITRVSDVPGVTAVAAFVKGDAAVSRNRVNLGVVLEGIEEQQYAQVIKIAKQFEGGKLPKLGPAEIAIGFRMADKLGVTLGEHINVTAPGAQRLMRVKAIFRSGYYEKDLHHAYVALTTAQRMFNMGSEVSGLAMACVDLNEAQEVSENLRNQFPFEIRNWRDDNASLLAEVATVKRITFFINVLVAMVAAVGMANVFSVFVLNHQKELAILRAMGASRFSLKAILFLESALIWVLGTIIGCTAVLAVMAYEQGHPFAVSAETYGIASYSTKPSSSAFLGACGLAAATMALSAWWSGRKAAKLNPVEVIFGR